MATETLVFMPNGDVTLKLIRNVYREVSPAGKSSTKNGDHATSLEEVINDDDLLEGAPGLEGEAPEADKSVLYYAPDAPGSENGPLYPPEPRAKRGSDGSRRDRSESPPASFWATLKRQAAKVASDPVEDEPTPPSAQDNEPLLLSSHEVYCVVSSRHLMLASRYFETLLGGDYSEARNLRAKGHVEIPMLSEDFDTMTILLNIIHGASRKVPRQVTLEVLSRLAVLVSKLGMLETVEFFSDTWIDHLQEAGLPKMYNVDVLPLLFVFWVFDRPKEFKDMTKMTQRESNERLDDDLKSLKDVKIPPTIIDAIKRDREFAMETAITVIHALITRYMDGSALCDAALDDELRYACDAMVLGSLLKSSRKIGIWPKPEAPFPGRKFKDLAKAIRSIRILDVCNKTSTRRWNSHGPSNNAHGLEDSIEASMKDIEAGLDGLELADFARKSEIIIPVSESYVQPKQIVEPIPQSARPIRNSYHNARPNSTSIEEVMSEKMELPSSTRRSSVISEPQPRKVPSSIPQTNGRQQQETNSAYETRGRSPPKDSIRENGSRSEAKMAPRESSAPSLFSWPSGNSAPVDDHEVSLASKQQQSRNSTQQEAPAVVQEREVRPAPRQQQSRGYMQQEVPAVVEDRQVTAAPRQQQSTGYMQQEQQASPRNSVHMQSKPASRSPPLQQVQVVSVPNTMKASSTPLPPSPREETPVSHPRDVSKVAAAEKKLNRISSYPQIAVGREDVKSPAPVEPRVISIEETTLPEGVSLATRPATTVKVISERTSPPTPVITTTPGIIKGRESPLKQVQGVNNGLVDDDDEDVWIPPAQNYRARKGKKTFSTRFS